MRKLIIILALFSLCSCYSKRQGLTALHNIQKLNREGAVTDSIYSLKHK